jgi:hypothetical protein
MLKKLILQPLAMLYLGIAMGGRPALLAGIVFFCLGTLVGLGFGYAIKFLF